MCLIYPIQRPRQSFQGAPAGSSSEDSGRVRVLLAPSRTFDADPLSLNDISYIIFKETLLALLNIASR